MQALDAMLHENHLIHSMYLRFTKILEKSISDAKGVNHYGKDDKCTNADLILPKTQMARR